MLNIFRIIILLLLAAPMSACGLKGKLKTPEQIQKIEAKKAQEEEKKALEAEKKQADPTEDMEKTDAESVPAEKK